MPLTITEAELDRLIAESMAFEAKYRDTPYKLIPADEIKAERDREVRRFELASASERQAILEINSDSIGRAA